MAATTATGSEVEVTNADGVRLSLSRSGPFDGRPVVLLHGLAVTRDHVLMGSTALADAGFHVVAFDARGHGRSAAAPDPTAYRYQDLTGDLVAVMDGLGIERAVLVGASMGCHTALRVALQEPARVAGIVAITPAFDPRKPTDPRELDDARR